jgi:hypothetical protein
VGITSQVGVVPQAWHLVGISAANTVAGIKPRISARERTIAKNRFMGIPPYLSDFSNF